MTDTAALERRVAKALRFGEMYGASEATLFRLGFAVGEPRPTRDGLTHIGLKTHSFAAFHGPCVYAVLACRIVSWEHDTIPSKRVHGFLSFGVEDVQVEDVRQWETAVCPACTFAVDVAVANRLDLERVADWYKVQRILKGDT